MILAGGLSTRLYPLTKQLPKPLVPVLGVPNTVHVIRYLASYGYTEIAINVHYLAQAIHDALGDGSQFGVRLTYLHEDVLMGSAGAIKPLESFFSSESHFVVVGCDDLTDLPLDRLVALHEEKDALATIGLVERPKVDQYGVVVLDKNDRIVGFQEKPAPGTEVSRLANTGVYCFTPQIFGYIPAAEFWDFGKQVFPQLQSEGAPFYGFNAPDAYWCDIGTPDEYRRATFDVLNGVVRIPKTRATGIDPSAKVDRSATIADNVWVGANARIGRDVRVIGPSVIGDRDRLDEGAVLERSILWDDVCVVAHHSVSDSIVGRCYTVDRDLRGAVVANDEMVTP
jgi:mannose-1-phosphate guanylyltransferase